MAGRRNDGIRAGAAMSALVLRIGIVVVVAGAALLLVPSTLWQVVAVAAAVLGVFIPQSLGGWLAIASITVGMLLGDASIWRAMVAVCVVHLCHVVFSLLLAIPMRSRVVLRALVPTLRRVLTVQLLAQPLTVLVMLLHRAAGGTAIDTGAVVVAPIVGAGALAIFAIVFLLRLNRSERGS